MLITRHSRQRGYGIEVGPRGVREIDSIVCAHCGGNEWMAKPGNSDLGARCTCCDDFICEKCIGKGCMPLEMRLDQWERYNSGRKYLRKDRLFEIFQASGKR